MLNSTVAKLESDLMSLCRNLGVRNVRLHKLHGDARITLVKLSQFERLRSENKGKWRTLCIVSDT